MLELAERNIDQVDQSLAFQFNWHINVVDRYLKDKYYRCLSSFCNVFKINRVLEYGTCSGLSALCLSQYTKHVDTFDISEEIQDVNLLKHFNFNKLDRANDILNTPRILDYEVIFVDIDHLGETELLLHQRFSQEFKGIVFYDDINLNTSMRDFWEQIIQEKVELDWHFSGFGAVLYR